jgi:adenylate kinase
VQNHTDNHSVQALVLFGPPGSGKGTQAKMLKERLGVPHISTGDMLREHIRTGNSVGKEAAALMKVGSLAPDDIVNHLVADRLADPDCARGFILDGYPRTRQQAETLDRWLEARGIEEQVVHLVVDYAIIIKRITGRRQCPGCGSLYNLNSRPPKSDGLCDRDGAELMVREDDREDVVRERLAAYERQTRPLLDYFRQVGRRLHEIDASRSTPQELLETIVQVIEVG